MRYVFHASILMTVLSGNVFADTVPTAIGATPTPVVTPIPLMVTPAPIVAPEPVMVTPAPAVTPEPLMVTPAPTVTPTPVVKSSFSITPAPMITVFPVSPSAVTVNPVPEVVTVPAAAPVKTIKTKKPAKIQKTKQSPVITTTTTVTPVVTTTTTTKTMIMPNEPPITEAKHVHTKRHTQYCSTVKKEPWRFTIAPYVWGMNMNGNIQVANRTVPVHEQFSDILSDFKGGGMLLLEAQKGNLGFFANILYAYLNRQVSVGKVTFKPIVKFGLYTLGASYKVYAHTFNNCTNLAVEPYLGARYTQNDLTIKVINTTSQVGKNEHWTDPIIGARLTYTMNPNWLTVFAGDVGGTNFDTQKSYNLNAYIGYVPTSKCNDITLYAGYRLLYQHYTTGYSLSTFAWKMHMFGPVLGIAFKF